MNNEEKILYSNNPSIFQKYIRLTNQKQVLVEKVCKKLKEKNIQNKVSVLDIGCGDGIVTIPIIENLVETYNLEVNVIDSSIKLLKCFKEKCTYDVNFINQDVELLNKLPKSDFILVAHVLSYISNLEKILEKITNSLKHKGIALIVLNNASSDDVKIKNKSKPKNDKYMTSDIVKKILSEKKIKYDVEIVESEIDVSGVDPMNENGKTIIEFFNHKQFEEILPEEIEKMRKIILDAIRENKKIIKREDYIWILN